MTTRLKTSRKIAITLTILIAIEIFYLSCLPGDPLSTGGNVWLSRAYHFVVFFTFSFFLFMSIKSEKEIKIEQILLVLMLSSLYAITDEIHQIFTPFRNCTFADFMTNLVGINSAILLYIWTNKKS